MISVNCETLYSKNMSFIDNIEKLHKKPDHIKRRILLASVFVLMFIVVSVWVSTLRITLGKEGPKNSQVSSPLSVFFGIIKGGVDAGVNGVMGSVNKLKQNYEPKQGE